MQCHVIILDTTGTPYTFYVIEKRKETIEDKTKTKKTNRQSVVSTDFSRFIVLVFALFKQIRIECFALIPGQHQIVL